MSTAEQLDRIESKLDSWDEWRELADSRFELILKELLEMKKDVSDLKDDMKDVKSDVHDLKDDMKDVKSDVHDLKSDMTDVKKILIADRATHSH